jgi:hypothetical protein
MARSSALENRRLLAVERTVSRSRTSRTATRIAAAMATRRNLPEGSKKPPQKEVLGESVHEKVISYQGSYIRKRVEERLGLAVGE